MKKSTVHALLFVGTLITAACNDKKTESTSTTSVTDTAMLVQNNDKHVVADSQNMVERVEDAMNGNQDSNFVVKATIANNGALLILQAGLENGTDKELKNHAKMMMVDHKKLGTDVKQFATQKGYAVPTTDKGKAEDYIADVNKKNKGEDWDKEWVDKVVDEHENEIRLFEKAQGNVKDEALKTMITNTLPILRSHLNMVKTMQDKIKHAK